MIDMTVDGKWVVVRETELGTYYRYEVDEKWIDSRVEFFLPKVASELDKAIGVAEGDLMLRASWAVFLRNQKLTAGG